MRSSLIFVLLALVVVVPAVADDWYVSTSGNDNNNGTSPGSAWRTITHAVEWIADNQPGTAGNPAIIHLAPGTYQSTGDEDFPIDIPSDIHSVEIRGDRWENTVIQGDEDDELGAFQADGLYSLKFSELHFRDLTWILEAEDVSNQLAFVSCRMDEFVYEGNGYDQSAILLEQIDGTFTLNDCHIEGARGEDDGAALYANSCDADFMISGCTFIDNIARDHGGAFRLHHIGDVTITNVSTMNNEAERGAGGAFRLDTPGALTITQLNMYGDRAKETGGGFYSEWNTGTLDLQYIYAEDCESTHSSGGAFSFYMPTAADTARMSNIYVSDCDAKYYGGGFRIISDTNPSPMVMQDVTVDNCHSSHSPGGGLAVSYINNDFIMRNVTATNCTSKGNGGGIFLFGLDQVDVRLDQINVSNCEAVNGMGGGLAVDGSQRADSLVITNLGLCNNEAKFAGGGMYIWGHDVRITGFNVSGNVSTHGNNYNGSAAMKFSSPSTVVLTDGAVIGNQSGHSGQANGVGAGLSIYEGPSVHMKNVLFRDNVVHGDGGGAWIHNPSEKLIMEDVAFVNNSNADFGSNNKSGGGLYITSGHSQNNYGGEDYVLRNVLFAGNYAKREGGAAVIQRVSVDLVNVTAYGNEADRDGDSFWLYTPEEPVEVYSSILWGNSSSDGTVTSHYEAAGEFAFYYSNIEYDGGDPVPGTENINEDPNFTAPQDLNFQLGLGSQSIDRGLPFDENNEYSIGDHELFWMQEDTILVVPDSGAVTISFNTRIDQGFWGIPMDTEGISGCAIPTIQNGSGGFSGDDDLIRSNLRKVIRRDRYAMIGAPLLPDSANGLDQPQFAFGDDVKGTLPIYLFQSNTDTMQQTWRFSRWVNEMEVSPDLGYPDNTFRGYVRYHEIDSYRGIEGPDPNQDVGEPVNIRPGYGYFIVYNHGVEAFLDSVQLDITRWMLPVDPYVIDMEGAVEDQSDDIRLWGYNMMANPWPFPIQWSDCEVSADGDTWYTVAEASEGPLNWISPYAYTINHLTGEFATVTGQIDVWEGFYVIVKTDQDLWLRFNPSGGGERNRLELDELDEILDWSALISARVTDKLLVDYSNLIGVGPDLENGADNNDGIQMTPLNSEYLMLRSRPVTADGATDRLTFDLRENDLEDEGYKAWLMELWYYRDANKYGVPAGETEVEVTWPIINNLPDGVTLSVFDYGDQNWGSNEAYQFNPEDPPMMLVGDMRDQNSVVLDVATSFGPNYMRHRFWIVASNDPGMFGNDSPVADAALPTETRLGAVGPNPFNSFTTIRFELHEAAHVKLQVFNMLGQRVAVLADRPYNAGYHNTVWNAANMASGSYFVRFEVPGMQSQLRKMILMK
ncbi:DUF1565 domain-containing protein [bacterium]|nr:DUF1565 domain-containing protein [bacterium]